MSDRWEEKAREYAEKLFGADEHKRVLLYTEATILALLRSVAEEARRERDEEWTRAVWNDGTVFDKRPEDARGLLDKVRGRAQDDARREEAAELKDALEAELGLDRKLGFTPNADQLWLRMLEYQRWKRG